MHRILTILSVVPLLTAPAYARSHCNSHPYSLRHATQRCVTLPQRIPTAQMAPMNHMPSAGELNGNTGGYEHPEGAGTTSAP